MCALTLVLFLSPSERAVGVAQPQDAPPGRPRENFDRSGDGPRGRFRENGPRGRWRDRRGGGEDRAMDRPIPPEMIDKIMELVRDKFPERFDRLADLEAKNPRRFEMLIRRMAPVAIEYFKLRERRPELADTIIREFKNQERLHELSDQFRKAKDDPAKQAAIETQIEQIVRSQVELFQERMEFRLQDFEERIAEQQRRLAEQRRRFDEEKLHSEDRIAERIKRIKEGDVRPDFPGRGPNDLERFGPDGPGPRRFHGDGPPGEDRGGPRRRGPHEPAAPDDEPPAPPEGD